MTTVHSHKKQKKVLCPISTCKMEFCHVDNLVQHLRVSHGARIESNNIKFNNKDDFEKFLRRESDSKNTRYVQHRKKTTNKDNSITYTLVCHRSGHNRKHLKKGENYKGRRRENRKGTCKINNLCPSRMSVREKVNGTVSVRYVKSHTHSVEVEESKYMPIPENIRSDISSMLAMRVPINHILDKVRENFANREE